jgi:hypothetical protein
MKHDEWFELEVPPNELMAASRMSNSSMGHVHLIVKWIFCRKKYLETGLKKLAEILREELDVLEEIRVHLSSFSLPFSQIPIEEEDEDKDPSTERLAVLADGGDIFSKLVIQEKVISERVDQVTVRLGFTNVPWFSVALACLAIYLLLTVLTMFFRTDFFNVGILTFLTL